ncbi:MAG: hypothetical protein C0427_17290 [Rhodobacter sp.]|nr:hypothetical protein [Rhodobacter sp.]
MTPPRVTVAVITRASVFDPREMVKARARGKVSKAAVIIGRSICPGRRGGRAARLSRRAGEMLHLRKDPCAVQRKNISLTPTNP